MEEAARLGHLDSWWQPLLTLAIGVMIAGHSGHAQSWLAMYQAVVPVYALFFLPLLAGLLASLCCRTEHLAGGWKQMLALPVPRIMVDLSKVIVVAAFLAVAQALVWAGVLAAGSGLFHLSPQVPWAFFERAFIGGWLAAIPIAALQLWVSTWWKSFGAQFAVSVIFMIPAIIVAGSPTYGPFYPWAQPMLDMVPTSGSLHLSPASLFTIAGAGVLFLVFGCIHFVRKDITA